jgi:hypothetical protein
MAEALLQTEVVSGDPLRALLGDLKAAATDGAVTEEAVLIAA